MALGTQTVGVDIGSSGIKAVALRKSRSEWSLVAAGESPLPDPSVRGDSTVDATVVTEAVSQLLDSLGLKRARVVVALPGDAVIVKRLAFPAMSRAELAEALPWEAEQYLPFELGELQLDYEVLNPDSEASGLDVLLVASKKDCIDERTAIVNRTGRQAAVIDVEAFALANAYQMNYPERREPFAVLVHVGRRGTLVCVLERGQPVYTTNIAMGGRSHLEALLRELGSGGVTEATANRILQGQVPSNISGQQVATVLCEASAQIVLEVRRTIDSYRAAAPAEKLSRIVVSGGACQAVGLVDLLASEFGVPVELFDPVRRVTKSSRTPGAKSMGPRYAVAVGLAMRQEGDN